MRNWLNIVPARNLVQNIGFGENATHTVKADQGLRIAAQSLGFPITHPPALIDWPDFAEKLQDRFFTRSLFNRARAKLSLRLLAGD
jgi:hypothetical protein